MKLSDLQIVMAKGTRVLVNPVPGSRFEDIFGVIVGYCFLENVPHYLIELEAPKWTQGKDMYIRIIVAHPDSVDPANTGE